MANNNQELNNLKAIHKIQVAGEIQNLLRQLRNGKSIADNLSKKVVDMKRQKELQAISEQTKAEAKTIVSEPVSLQPSVKPQAPIIEETKVVQVAQPKPAQVAKTEEKPAVKQEFAVNNKPKPNFEPRKDYQNNRYPDRKFDQNNNQNVQKRVFDNSGNTERRPYNQPYQQRPYNPQFQQRTGSSPYQPRQNGQPYQNNNFAPRNPNAPFGQRNFQGSNASFPQRNFQNNNFGQRNFQGGNNAGRPQKSNLGFVQSKANNMRVFPTLESSAVLAQPERNHGNKNKTLRNVNVEEKSQKYKKNSQRNFVLDEDFEEVTMGSRKLIKNKKKEETFIAPAVEHAVITTKNLTVKILSEKIGKPVTEIIKKLMILGIMATINSAIDFATAELVASELGVTLEEKLEITAEQELTAFVKEETENEEDIQPRPPVVAVMGHVDHGKTSLLDIIRKENVVSGEAGGITQRIGAYQITTNGQKITFLDTPGHAAFTSMRARGAKITDVAILVVAADDGIMPQTIEAMNHIKSAKIPMIVAVNKMDKKDANPERIKQQLSEQGALPEEWGGDTILVPVSAKTGVGIDKLLSMILLVAQMQELKANPKKLAVGAVIEASLDKSKGPVATILVQNGTLRVGDTIISGITYGKVKAMYDEAGNQIKEATPSTPVSVLGLNEVPQSGDQVYAVDEKLSRQVIEERKNKIKNDKTDSTSGVSLDTFMDRVNEGKLKNLNLIIKADAQGSVEALKQSLLAVSNDEVKVVCVHSGAGPVTESDLVLAQASSAIVINFNLKVENKIKQIADGLGVEIKDYRIIYEVVEEISAVVSGMRAKVYEKVVTGHAEVRAIFKLSSSGTIAGCYVTDGKMIRNGGARVLRGSEELIDTAIEALKIQKDDKSEVNYSYECGIKLKDFTSFAEGDIIECYQKVEVKK